MNRYGFLLKVKQDRLEEYKRRHQQVWPDMLAAISRAGWCNYSLYLRDDGLLFGYFESPFDLPTALENLGREEVNTRWQEYMKDFFEAADNGSGRADENMVILPEVFHLD